MSITPKQSGKAPPIHPGELLCEDFLKPLGMTSVSLATALKVPVRQILGIVNKRARMSAELAMRLERYFGTSADFWMDSQMNYDLKTTENDHGASIRREVHPAPRDRKTGALLKHRATA